MGKALRIGIVVGTRPEAIKLAPVVWELRDMEAITPVLISTGQHRELLLPALEALGLAPDYGLDIMRASSGLSDLTARAVRELGGVVSKDHLDALVVQGDTTTAFAGALAAFYAHLPVAHVEAGLRSGKVIDPFPEEMNRRVLSILARWHFAPTETAAKNLRAEGIRPEAIEVTGNTVVDTLRSPLSLAAGSSAFRGSGRKILVTLHRRENQGEKMRLLGDAIAAVSDESQAEVVLPLHKSPAVQASLLPAFSNAPYVRIIEPLAYFDFLATMRQADLLITDSGGVLEESTALGIPCVVCRETTERPEAFDAGAAVLAGTNPAALASTVLRLLQDDGERSRMSLAPCPFGDGKASARIVNALVRDLW